MNHNLYDSAIVSGLGVTSLGTILIVEDDEAVRTAISLLLESAGYHVLEAADGVDAIAHLATASSSVVLIILDLAMPGMSGRAFREHQLADAEFALIPTIVLSGAISTEEDIEHLRVRAIIPKPFVFEELLRFVHAYAKAAPSS